MPDLEVRNLCFRDRGPYSFHIAGGECVGLRGASGTGKSLLLRAMVDLDQRTGTMRLGAIQADEVAAPLWRRMVGLLPAESYWWLESVGEHFADFSKVKEDVLVALGFDRSVGNWHVSRLSTGEKQRLAIIRLLANQPRCLLLDEPTASLDQCSVSQVEELLIRYCRDNEVPMLWVSHDPAQLGRVCHRRFLMENKGLLVGAGVLQNGC
ncbi:ATP-binding cassette domain-containing protein [Desulfobulbus alkaliphilus]|nr:ATP-binding cassette domain-containing protein [Desulfobulbus alkaliphilus]